MHYIQINTVQFTIISHSIRIFTDSCTKLATRGFYLERRGDSEDMTGILESYMSVATISIRSKSTAGIIVQ